jgi:hypothetical protein
MDGLEEELRRALARRDAPPGFAGRVLGEAERRRPRRSARRWLAVAASLALMAGSAAGWRQYQGAVAKRQVMLALRITAEKLNRIQTQVREVRP